MAQSPAKAVRRPKIILNEVDYRRLNALADQALDAVPDVANELFEELDRANVVQAGQVPATVVQMGSTVEFTSDTSQGGRITLVYPGEADIEKQRVSILTPIGTALIGLSPGQTINFTDRMGKKHALTVVSVAPPTANVA